MTTEITTLSNGLRVVTDRIDTVDTVSLGLWVDVGTRHEAPQINGVAPPCSAISVLAAATATAVCGSISMPERR